MKKAEEKELKEQKIAELEQLFKDTAMEKQALVSSLIEQYAFMYVQLKKMNEIIEKEGPIEKFKQGKQQFMREQPALKSYNTTMKTYNATTKQLSEFLPPGKQIQKDDEFQSYKDRVRNR